MESTGVAREIGPEEAETLRRGYRNMPVMQTISGPEPTNVDGVLQSIESHNARMEHVCEGLADIRGALSRMLTSGDPDHEAKVQRLVIAVGGLIGESLGRQVEFVSALESLAGDIQALVSRLG